MADQGTPIPVHIGEVSSGSREKLSATVPEVFSRHHSQDHKQCRKAQPNPATGFTALVKSGFIQAIRRSLSNHFYD